ncbi:MAG: heat-inducible transcriptional repressor HrcA [Exiguobacterium oxidotolerans]|uniref:Heat-inducible transcription repressor HrcA n=1 Tax=Exiguobacterium oxidotolerans TaxID=223958 RepID=A0A653IGD3_9BACL|nr:MULTISPECIES: heat-inducible transcriptional repressor HrcA [Exiguobacterium]ASI34745.1 heat-inducible transcription repressor HrcA [Exiguobacterium sp. N4-1P]VWX38082.1 transcriptional regulator of heat-shock genes [Exiguobacterium oxidotolerans]
MLTDRQLLILRAIVDDYIKTAQPVGSRTLSKRDDVTFSSATIRNEMADLEEMGLIEKPHTSAGRIPSELGYRFYVDHLIRPESISPQEAKALKSLFAHSVNENDRLIRHTADLLSELTHYTTLVLGPKEEGQRLHHLELIPLAEGRVVIVLVTETGHVEHKTLQLAEALSREAASRLMERLNKTLRGTPLSNLRIRLLEEIRRFRSEHSEQTSLLSKALDIVLMDQQDERPLIYLGGKANMFDQPEFQDVAKLRPVLELIEQQEALFDFLSPNLDNQILITIGSENNVDALKDCSVIRAHYSVDGVSLGTLALIGPKRMDYNRGINSIIHLLQAFQTELRKNSLD